MEETEKILVYYKKYLGKHLYFSIMVVWYVYICRHDEMHTICENYNAIMQLKNKTHFYHHNFIIKLSKMRRVKTNAGSAAAIRVSRCNITY